MKKLSSAIVKPPANPPKSTAEIRKHYFLEQYVIIAPSRNQRPESFTDAHTAHKIADSHCPFCNPAETAVWQTPSGPNWQVKVIANKYPALSRSNPEAFGIQEVVINTPNHDLEFSDLPVSHIESVFNAYRHRLKELSRIPGIRYILVFKNDGPLAGASVAHAHCQIIALPLVPPRIKHEADALNHYWDDRQSCAYCDIITWETNQKVRLITDDKHFLVISPLAPTSAYEVWFLPRRHLGSFHDLTTHELGSLAHMLKKICAKLDSASISFNYYLQESLSNQNHHFVIKLEPRLNKFAGAELGTGVIINPVPPETATLWYLGQPSPNPESR